MTSPEQPDPQIRTVFSRIASAFLRLESRAEACLTRGHHWQRGAWDLTGPAQCRRCPAEQPVLTGAVVGTPPPVASALFARIDAHAAAKVLAEAGRAPYRSVA